jgi:hypothetical protein
MTPTPSTATTSTLTDRYVGSTLRSLPARQRPDIERELRASIADAVDTRVEAGDDPAEAEHAVLTELGDPARLAARYADRPLHLIGPTVYLDYIRLLVALLVIVVPIAAGAVGFARILEGGGVGSVVGEIIDTGISVAVHIFFWTTLLFAVIERSPNLRSGPTGQWTPAALPPLPKRRARLGALIGETVAIVLLTAFVLLSPVVSTETDANGDPIGILSPWLWDTGMVFVFLALAFGGFGITVAKHYVRWSATLAVAGALLTVASATVLIWVAANGRLLNPAFVDAAGWPDGVTRWINLGLVVTAVIALAQTVVETVAGFVARSWVTPDWNQMIQTAVNGVTTRGSRRRSSD